MIMLSSSPLSLSVSLSTAYAEYILMDASDDYADIMASVQEKIYLSKVTRNGLY